MKSSRVWRIIRRVGIWVGSVLAILFLGVLLLVFHKVDAPVVHRDPAAVVQLNARLKQAEGTASPASPQVLRADQTEVNSVLDSYLGPNRNAQGHAAPTPVRDLRLNLMQDRIRMYLVLDFHGKDVTVELEGKLRTENGFLRFDPLSGKVGAMPIPKSTLESSMRKMMNSPEARENLRLPGNLKDVHVEDGRIVATFE
jgi:hypothetical protein